MKNTLQSRLFISLMLALCLGFAESGCTRGNAPPVEFPQSTVRIQRDSWGVPHIVADSMADAAFAQGYAEASDRLLQLDLMRRTAHGSQSEVLGENRLEMDKLVRTLGFVPAAELSWQRFKKENPETIAVLEGWTAGINRYLEDLRSGENGAAKPADLVALDPDYIPPAFSPVDALAIGRAAMFSLSAQLETDLMLEAARRLMEPETFAKMVLFAPLAATTIFPPEQVVASAPLSLQVMNGRQASSACTEPERTGHALAHFFDLLTQLRNSTGYTASNNWAVSGAFTRNGSALLASDPHGGIPVPSNMYESHIRLAGSDVDLYGVSVVGAPMIHFGHSRYSAWAFTNYMADVGDLYLEQDGEQPDTVLRDGKDLKLQARTEIILVRPRGGSVAEAKEVRLEVREVPGHGPILSDVLPDPLPLLFSDGPISYRWTGNNPTREALAFMRLGLALDWEAFLAALRYFDVGAQNAVFAGINGDTGYTAWSLLPIRSWDLAAFPPIGPLPGTGQFEWAGFRRWEDRAEIHPPAEGFVLSANNDPFGGTLDGNPWNSDYFGYMYDIGFRAERIQKVLSDLTTHKTADLATMAGLQTDVTVQAASYWMPRLFPYIAKVTLSTDPLLRQAASILRDWDLQGSVDSSGAALFHVWMARLLNDWVAKPVLSFLRPLLTGNLQFGMRELYQAITSDDREIFPIGVSAAVNASFAAAVMQLNSQFMTTDVTRWKWGFLHMRHLRHPMRDWQDDARFDLGPIPVAGGFAVVNRSDFSFLDENGLRPFPWEAADGADTRLLIEMQSGSWSTRVIMPHGSSGDPASPHYDDQFPLWVAGIYRNALYTPEEVAAAAVTELTIDPR